MTDACSLFPYLPGYDHLTAAHADEFERLNRAICAKGGFRLLFAQYNLPQYRNILLNRLACLHENSRFFDVEKEYPKDFRQLYGRMAELAEDAAVLHLIELEYWTVDAEKEWLSALNYQREPLARACPLPVVLWLPGRLIKMLALHAPDVWAWRAGVFDFSVKAEIDAPLHIKNDTAFLNTDERQRRQQRIWELQTYLAGQTSLPKNLRASLLGELGELYKNLGQPDEALECFNEALEFYRSSDLHMNIALVMGQIADIYQVRGELDEALRIRQEEELPIYERLGDVRSRAVTMGYIANIYRARGELNKALRILKKELLPAFERLGDVRSRAVTMGKIADIYQARGELDEALRIRRQESLPVYERLGDVRLRAVTMGKIADIYQARGEFDEALRIHREESLPVYERLGDVRERAVTMGKIADIYQVRGELDKALRIRREESLPVYERLGDVRSRAVTMGQIADVYQARGELDEALRIRQEEELPVYERLGDVRSRTVTMGQIADIYQGRGDLEKALHIRQKESLPVYERLGDARGLLITQAKIGMIYLQLNPPKPKEANRLFCQALSAARQMNIPEAETIQNILKQNNMTCDEV